MELAQSLGLTFLLRGESNLPQQKLLAETARAQSAEAALCKAVLGEVEGFSSSKVGVGAIGRREEEEEGSLSQGLCRNGSGRALREVVVICLASPRLKGHENEVSRSKPQLSK